MFLKLQAIKELKGDFQLLDSNSQQQFSSLSLQ